MNKKIQKLLSVLVAVLLLVSALPFNVLAAESGSTTVTANVVAYTVTVLTPHPGGTVNIIAPLTIYEGNEVSFTANPEPGYTLKSIVWYTTDPTKATDITEAKKLTMPGADVNVKVEFAQLFTVSFDLQGHGDAISPITNVMDGTTVNAPSAPSASGYTFGGWYKDAGCKTAWNFGVDVITADTTLYAKWIENSIPKKAISGNVTEGGANVPGATVELFLGTVKVAATVTDEDGIYSFENVENGTYNIVVTKEDGKTKTEMVTINDSSATVNVELPVSEINSKVEHKGTEVPNAKSDISKTVVGNLDKVAEKHQPQNNGDKVTIKLTVEPKADTNTAEQQEIKAEAGDVKKVEFLDLSLLMQTNNEEPVNIGNENDELLTIVIPFDFTNVDVTSVMILRNHGGKTEKLTSTPNEYGEYVQINEAAGNITLCVMKFSDYAVAYDTLNEEEEDDGECVRTETVKLTENGTYGLKLNCRDMGKFTFAQMSGGWSIYNGSKYLAMQDGKLTYSDSPFAWTYNNGAFSTSVTTEQKSSGHWFLFWYVPGRGCKTVTTTYYLSTVTEGAKLSTCCVCAELYKEVSGEHEYGCWIDCKDGVNHKHVCKYCGKTEIEAHKYDEITHKCLECDVYDPDFANVKISVVKTEKTTKQSSGWWSKKCKEVTTYTYTIKTEATGTKVSKTEYSVDGGKTWCKGTAYSSTVPLASMLVRVTDSNGRVYDYEYKESEPPVCEHEYGCAVYVDKDAHKYVCKHCGDVKTEAHSYDGTTHKCICGAVDPDYQWINVTAAYATKQTKQHSGWFGWLIGKCKTVTTYTATVKVEANGVKVTKVEVAASENGCWTNCNTFTSNTKIDQFFVRVTTSDGAKHLFRVVDGIGYPAN